MKSFLVTTQSFRMAFTVVKTAGEFCGTVSDFSRTLSSQNVGTKVNTEPRLSMGNWEHRLRCAFSVKLSIFSTKSSHIWIIVLRATSEFELPRSGRRKRENNNKKLWTCSTIFGRFLCSHHTTIVVKLDRNGNPIPVAVGSSNQCSLLQSYIVDNYSVNQCNETNRVHLFACSIETFNSSDILVNLRNRTGEERRRQTLRDKRDNNFVWNNFSPKFTFL